VVSLPAQRWTRAKVKELQFYVFPGGYSAHETRGDCTFDLEAAYRAVNFGPLFFKHVKGEKGGQPIELEEWQAALIACMFGYKRPDGTRRYRMVYLEVPRGNGKSTLCVIIVGILLYIDDEPGADIFSAAGSRDQAKEVFNPFKLNVLGNADLCAISQPYQNSVTRLDETTGLPIGVYKAISAEAGLQHGGSPHGIIFDELHVQPDSELWDVLQTGKIKRTQPLTVAITTAGFDRNSICYIQHEYAEKVRDGLVTDQEFLPAIYAADRKADWTDPQTWRDANPNIGVSIKEAALAVECAKAKEMPSYENTFKRLHLNIWTEADVRWITFDKWQLGDEEVPDLTGCECWGGMDLSSTTDLSSLVLAFKRPDGGLYLLCWLWAPEEQARQRAKRDRAPYLEWANQGFLTLTPGSVVDYDRIRADVNEIGKQYNIREIAIDRWNSTQLTSQLMGDGFEMALHGQGYASMSGPAKEFEAMVCSGSLQHGGNPALAWMASNVAIEQDAAGNIKPSKKKSVERIDGIVAAVMAVGRAVIAGESSIYDTQGIATVASAAEQQRAWWQTNEDDDE
jgi:phage terminase large subunit-like protein